MHDIARSWGWIVAGGIFGAGLSWAIGNTPVGIVIGAAVGAAAGAITRRLQRSR